MNTQAAFKTLLIVLGIGAITGFKEWNHTYGGTPAEQAQRQIASCIREQEMALYQANPGPLENKAERIKRERIPSECKATAEASLPKPAPLSYLDASAMPAPHKSLARSARN
jgi:hypothetical protein